MVKPAILIRTIIRNRLNSLAVLISLSVGIACFNLILLFISRELKTDTFHSDSDRIFALKYDDPWIPGRMMYHCKYGSSEFMKKNFTFVDDFCRISNANPQKVIVNNTEYFSEDNVIAASANFFSFFSYRLLTGNPATVLESRNKIVISDHLALKYFGTTDASGRVIRLVRQDKAEDMTITGIFESPSENTQILFDMVRSAGETDSRCYVKLIPGADKSEAEKIFAENKGTIPVVNTGTPGPYYLEPLHSAYFDTTRGSTIEASRDKKDIWIALIIGILIIGVASFNYLGLLNNRIMQKNRENAIRTINGATKYNLVIDFLAENGIITAIAFLLSIFILEEMLPFFNELTGSNIDGNFLFRNGNIPLLLSVVFFIIILTFIFGLFRIESFSLDSEPNTGSSGRTQFRVLNILQLACSVGLIICCVVIIKQMYFISEKPIGLDRDIIEVKIPQQFSGTVSVFRDDLLRSSTVGGVSVVQASPLLEHFLLYLEYEENGVKKNYSPAGFSGDEDYLDVMGIELIKGEGFSGRQSANTKICVVNQTFARFFPDKDLIGISVPGMSDQTITGIVKDFHYSGLNNRIEPAFISYSNKGTHLMVKSSGRISETRETIREIWNKLIPDYPVNIESVGERFEWYHRSNSNYLKLIISCSVISLFLAMLGLFVVSYENSRIRTKEIGVRKINGAGIIEILLLLNKDYVIWIMLAFVIASPVAWIAMNKWLQNFAYRTVFSWWIFPMAGIITLLIAVLTVTLQSLRTAARNPVEALRYE